MVADDGTLTRFPPNHTVQLLTRCRTFPRVSRGPPSDVRQGRASEVGVPEADGFKNPEAMTVRSHGVEREVLPPNPAVEGLCHTGADIFGAFLLGLCEFPLLAFVVWAVELSMIIM